jgi:hypothetical protein
MLQESSRLVIVSRSTAQQRRLTKGEEQGDIATSEDQRARAKAVQIEKDKILQHEEEEPQTLTLLGRLSCADPKVLASHMLCRAC